MLIVKIKDDNGFHPSEFQNDRNECWMEGYIEVPKDLESALVSSKGFCDLVIKEGVLTDVVPRMDRESDREYNLDVSPMEQLRADIDYLALMSGVNL